MWGPAGAAAPQQQLYCGALNTCEEGKSQENKTPCLYARFWQPCLPKGLPKAMQSVMAGVGTLCRLRTLHAPNPALPCSQPPVARWEASAGWPSVHSSTASSADLCMGPLLVCSPSPHLPWQPALWRATAHLAALHLHPRPRPLLRRAACLPPPDTACPSCCAPHIPPTADAAENHSSFEGSAPPPTPSLCSAMSATLACPGCIPTSAPPHPTSPTLPHPRHLIHLNPPHI